MSRKEQKKELTVKSWPLLLLAKWRERPGKPKAMDKRETELLPLCLIFCNKTFRSFTHCSPVLIHFIVMKLIVSQTLILFPCLIHITTNVDVLPIALICLLVVR